MKTILRRCSTVVQDVISELCSLLGVESEAEQLEFSLYCIVQGDGKITQILNTYKCQMPLNSFQSLYDAFVQR